MKPLLEDNILLQISNSIKVRRREKNITVQELATLANVSKGLISQIENSRTIPSLLVLIDIIKALDIDLNEFFKNIKTNSKNEPILVLRRGEYEHFEKENATGFSYQRILSRYIDHSTIDIVLLELEPNATRPLVETDAYEYKYLLCGEVDYHFDEETVIKLQAGDSILFDGHIPHTPVNRSNQKAVLLIIYFFGEKK